MKPVAVLSSTVINQSGTYRVDCDVPIPDVKGVPSYVGHPDTATLLGAAGVEPMPKGSMFAGLDVGQTFLAVPIKTLDRSRGWSEDQSLATLKDVRATLVTRLS